MTLKYELKFFDYWHLSSGLSGGAKIDSSVVKDKNALPYAPGKTIKGLLREMAEELGECGFVNECFGASTDTKDSCYDESKKGQRGVCYFSNASIDEQTRQEIITNKLQDHLYDIIASTKIGKKDRKNEVEGIAVDASLREIEVVVPISLYGEINDIPQEHVEKIKESLALIKRAGLNRNRGLGRCEFIVKELV